MNSPVRIAISSGEPAGIGPDLCVLIAQEDFDAELVVIADPELLKARAALRQLPLKIKLFDADKRHTQQSGQLCVLPLPTKQQVVPGKLNPNNASTVIQMLDSACLGCHSGLFDAMVTAPLHKGVINESGLAFTGHTEYLAEKLATEAHTYHPVMMLASTHLRVALLTTHAPLAAIPEMINEALIHKVIRILDQDLRERFHLQQPRIAVCGLNPHAGEQGHLGREEIDIIIPALEKLKAEGINVAGPLPADTAFTPAQLEQADVVLAMYHDQGLPVLKHQGFGDAVNITLGLPIIRTSVDHGTALDLAGSGEIDPGSLQCATELAIEMAQNARAQQG